MHMTCGLDGFDGGGSSFILPLGKRLFHLVMLQTERDSAHRRSPLHSSPLG